MSAASKPLEGKLAIVTGAGKPNGVGFASATALAEQGADVSFYHTRERLGRELGFEN